MIELEVVPYQDGDQSSKNSYIVSNEWIWLHRILCFVGGLMFGIIFSLILR